MKKQTMAIMIALQAAAITCTSNGMRARAAVKERMEDTPDGNSDASSHHESHHGSHHGSHHKPLFPLVPPSPRAVLNSSVTNRALADKLEQSRDKAAALKDTLTGIFTRYWRIARDQPIHQQESALLEHILTLPAITKEKLVDEKGLDRTDSPVATTEEILELLSEHGRIVGLQAAVIDFQETVVGKGHARDLEGHRHGRHHSHKSDDESAAPDPDEGSAAPDSV
jgi:hypothetical protein